MLYPAAQLGLKEARQARKSCPQAGAKPPPALNFLQVIFCRRMPIPAQSGEQARELQARDLLSQFTRKFLISEVESSEY